MNKPITQHVLTGCSEQNLHSHRPAVPPSLFLLLFTNTLQSHGRVMAGAPPLPLSSAVAKKQGVSYFDNSMLTQVRAEIFQLKKQNKRKKKGRLFWWACRQELAFIFFHRDVRV